jgi:tetratricopeptide (TPR) repeat protein
MQPAHTPPSPEQLAAVRATVGADNLSGALDLIAKLVEGGHARPGIADAVILCRQHLAALTSVDRMGTLTGEEVRLERRKIAEQILDCLLLSAAPIPLAAAAPLVSSEVQKARTELKFSISRMPVTSRHLFGREEELKQLDALWLQHKVNVVTLIAFGGVGKSALMNAWLRRLGAPNFQGAEWIYAWSFYTHGTGEPAGSGDLFVESALAWFGDPNPTAGTAWQKGERLAELVKRQRTLLLLDGLEPLQYPPGPQEGRIKEKDQGVQALLRELAANNPGLCIVSSRLPVADLTDYEGTTVQRIDLEHVKPEDGALLLRDLGVTGSEEELRQAAAEFDGHCLALTLLGSYLTDACQGDVRRRHAIGPLERDVRVGGHARRVMKSYETWFDGRPEGRLLRVLGLFDRPVDARAFKALTVPPGIPELTDGLTGSSAARWGQVVAALRRARLVSGADPEDPDSLDTHPLVREYFGERLRELFPAAWKAGNDRLYEHFKERAPALPTSLEEMDPLFRAVVFGCNAGREHDALHEIYLERIMRGDKLYAAYQLGALGPILAVLAHFFEAGDWGKPLAPNPPERQGLARADQWLVLIHAGMYHTAVKSFAANEAGRAFSRAVELSQADAERFPALRGIWAFQLVRNHIEEARRTVELLRRMAEDARRANYIVEARMALGVTDYFSGKFTEATENLGSAITSYNFEEHHTLSRTTGIDPCVVALTYRALAQWSLGRLNNAFRSRDEALLLVDRIGHPFSKCYAILVATHLAAFVGDPILTCEWGQQLTDFAKKQGSRMFLAEGHFYTAWASFEAARQKTLQPDSEERESATVQMEIAIRRMTEAEQTLAETEIAVALGRYLVVLAGAWGTLNRADEGLLTLRQARQLIDQGDRLWEAEWFRVKGDLLLTGPGEEQAAAACYEKALQIARQQAAKSLELRAATGYTRLLAQHGDKPRAKELLSGIYSWFTEGHDTRDLIEAKTLLDSL